jgi:hypothetical protein
LLWQRRYRRWVDTVLQSSLGQAQIVLIDDGSPTLPGWPDADIVTIHTPNDAASIRSSAPVLILRFPNRLGRLATYDFPGWYRSFATGAAYAAAENFQKILHIESDAVIISPRLHDWLRDTTTGWHALWSEKYAFPEIAVQLIGADQIANFHAFTSQPYENLVGVIHETMLPLTNIETTFTGDRYGETEFPVPAGVDYATQIPAQREPAYYWWRNETAATAGWANPVTYGFTRGDPSGIPLLNDGWAKPEPDGTWMLHALSVLTLPPLPQTTAFDLVLTAHAYTARSKCLVQRLLIQANAVLIGQFDLTGLTTIGCEIPPLLRRDGTDKLRFLHPDAESPSLHGSPDKRILSVQLRHLSLIPHQPPKQTTP